MTKKKDSGCLGYVVFYLLFIIIPVIAAALLGIDIEVISCLIFSFFIGGYISLHLADTLLPKRFENLFIPLALVVIAGLFVLSVNLFHIQVLDEDGYLYKKIYNTETSLSSAKSTTKSQASSIYKSTYSLSSYYQNNYPMTWGYIKKNADDPYEYIEFYHDIWGDMQEYTGDGINFDTLTRYEQSLVNYPRIGSYVYFSSSKSKEYHSTSMCYSLLKSDPISRPASQRYSYNPCSKCVGD